MELTILDRVEAHVCSLFQDNPHEELTFHNLDHTKYVVAAAKALAQGAELPQSQWETLTIAAWFHDTGYLYQRKDHEEKSALLAREFLQHPPSYPPEKIEEVAQAILCTKLSNPPQSLLEKILCDADLAHLGDKNLMKYSALLRKEWSLTNDGPKDHPWPESEIIFLSNHQYYTDYAQQSFFETKFQNLKYLKHLKNSK